MRIVKDGDVRRQELLDAALQLFYESGYDKTTIQAIIDKVGVSKGAFYYYFASKEEVLEAVARQYVEKFLSIIKNVMGDDRLNALEKYDKIIAVLQQYKAANKEQLWKIHKLLSNTENLKLACSISENTVALARAPFRELIEQGVEEGIFDIAFPEEAAEFLIYIMFVLNHVVSPLLLAMEKKPKTKKLLQRKLLFYENVLERILGVKPGSIKLAEPVLELLVKD